MKEPISVLEARIVGAENQAKRMLHRLETVLVRCGYTRDGFYKVRLSKRRYNPAILWREGKLSVARGADHDPAVVREMTTQELIFVGQHLSGFLDALEEGSRWTLRELERACERTKELIDGIEADPQPAKEPEASQ